MFSSSVTLSLVKLTVNTSQSESIITILENPQVPRGSRRKQIKVLLNMQFLGTVESIPFQIWT